MHRLHLGEIHDAVAGTEAGELPDRLAVGAARMCELKKSRSRARAAGRAKRARAGKRLGL